MLKLIMCDQNNRSQLNYYYKIDERITNSFCHTLLCWNKSILNQFVDDVKFNRKVKLDESTNLLIGSYGGWFITSVDWT